MGSLLIGIDVGGTNTDSVLLDPSALTASHRGVLAWHKAATTPKVEDGITDAISQLFKQRPEYSHKDVLAVTIGTTHFINAVIEQDRGRLEPVTVIRLCSNYSKGAGPFSDFPSGLANILNGGVHYVAGGNRVDGTAIQSLDEEAILAAAEESKAKGISAFAIVGIFSILDKKHELRAAELVRLVIPDANIACSHTISGIGYLARENATILNAAIMSFAANIMRSFIASVKNLGFSCPVLLSQNDGTITNDAFNTPIRTFSSGATNSMRGAGFLFSRDRTHKGESVIVVDIGGTTTDVGLLLPSGFPRQNASHSVVGGVRMNFSMPHTESIGLGGGSIVKYDETSLTVGPESVGSDITTKAKVFGGDINTATDLTVAVTGEEVGKSDNVKGLYSEGVQKRFKKVLKDKIERVIDQIKVSPEPLPVLLVGGGAFISPLELKGASKVIRPPFAGVANAIGAALGKVSAVIEVIEPVSGDAERNAVLDRLKAQVRQDILDKGALESSIEVIDLVHDPVPYVDRMYSFRIKVVADVDYTKVAKAFDMANGDQTGATRAVYKQATFKDDEIKAVDNPPVDYESYRPKVVNRQWLLSEVDLEFLRIGTYILGCGGGGVPYAAYLEARNLLRAGDTMKVISIKDAPETNKHGQPAAYIDVGFAGSPTVSEEQLAGLELMDASKALFELMGVEADGVFPLEIGGGNGFQGLLTGTSSRLNLPVIDADLMGRAYPLGSQILPCVVLDRRFIEKCAVSDGNGNQIIITGAQSDFYVEKMIRAALAEIGAHVGAVNNPMTAEGLRTMTVPNTHSQAWRIGRAVAIANQKKQISELPQKILDSIGGDKVGHKIFAGKIINVEKKLFKGHVYGEVFIEDPDTRDVLCIPFKNENILAKVKRAGSDEYELLASVPDLISVSYQDSGEAVGSPEYRYGVMVFVLAFAPYTLWSNTEKALNIGGPSAFGPAFEDVVYKPVGQYVDPVSVIDEYLVIESLE